MSRASLSKTLVGGLVALVVLPAGSTGCGSDLEISSDPLSGVINTHGWSFAVGWTDESESEGQDQFAGVISATNIGTCLSSPPIDDHIELTLPRETGDYGFGGDHEVIFVIGANRLSATDGGIHIEQITAQHVYGGVYAYFDDGNEIDGQFDVSICVGAN